MAASSAGVLLFCRPGGPAAAGAEPLVLAQRTMNGQCGFPKGPTTATAAEREAALLALEEQTGIHRSRVEVHEEHTVLEVSERGQPAVLYFVAVWGGSADAASMAVQFDPALFREVKFLPVSSVLSAEGLKARRRVALQQACHLLCPDYVVPEGPRGAPTPAPARSPPPAVDDRLLIVKLQAGSHLFGLHHDNSDVDFKAVYIPSLQDLLLGRISHTVIHGTSAGKNSRDDVDTETYSIHRFVEHAMEGAAFALDMLHAPPAMVLHRHPIWDALVAQKHRFYTRGFGSATSFVRSALLRAQSAFHANTKATLCDQFLDVLGRQDPQSKLAEVWDDLPRVEGVVRYSECRSAAHANQTLRIVTLCEKTLFENVRVKEATDCVATLRKKFARKAVEWKELSHAVRIADELQEVYLTGNITLPLPNRDVVRDIKFGRWDFPAVEALLQERLATLGRLAQQSTYPEEVDRAFWDGALLHHIAAFHGLPQPST